MKLARSDNRKRDEYGKYSMSEVESHDFAPANYCHVKIQAQGYPTSGFFLKESRKERTFIEDTMISNVGFYATKTRAP